MTVRLNETNFKGKLYSVLKFECSDPERRISDKRDKLTCKNSAPCENRLKSKASGYPRLHCHINDITSGISNNIRFFGTSPFAFIDDDVIQQK